MSRCQRNSRTLLTGTKSGSFWLRLFMLVTIWQGPFPWYHSHGTLANLQSTAPTEFVDHLRTQHASVDPLSNVDFGWHLHFLLPNSSGEDPQQSAPPKQDQLLIVTSVDCFIAHFARTHANPEIQFESRADLQGSGTILTERSQTRFSGHFYDAFASSLPLPLRFCVSRC